MSPTLDFLKAVLPMEGLKCAFVLPEKRHEFFATCEELEAFLLTQDGLGKTVYHACATYKTSGKRTKANALAAKAFWLDIDAGAEALAKWERGAKSLQTKPYADAVEAAEAVSIFCKAASFPPPTYVSSGSGIHAYWPLTESLNREEWESHAEGLKRLCQQHGLVAGRERTADIASILRPPGSHHRKAAPVVVRGGPLTGPYPLALFDRLRSDAKRSAIGALGDAPAKRRGRPPSTLHEALTHVVEHVPVASSTVADGCGHLAQFRDTGGNIPEPLWYAGIGVLAFCEDGESAAHEWSSGYEGYSQKETAEKFARAQRLTGATTCAHFAAVGDPEICKRCPIMGRINSPIAIRPKQWTSTPSSISSSPESVSAPSSPLFQNAKDDPLKHSINGVPLPGVPDPFQWGDFNQLCYVGEDKKGNATQLVVSEFPIYLDSVQTGEVQNERFSYMFKQWLPHEGWREIAVSARSLMGAEGIAQMFDRGASIRERELFRKYVVIAIDEYNRAHGLLTRFDQFGWKDDETAFLFGKNVYTSTGLEGSIGSDEVKVRSQWLGPKGGSLAAWTAAASKLFAKDCEAQSFALLASFAAPLMRFHADTEGGALVSLVSPQSGTGKTTALVAAASVWGRMEGLSLVNIDTSVSKSLTLSALGNLPVIYDELGSRDPELLKEFVLMFTNGRDKMRGTQEGTIRHTSASWQTLMLSASNLSIVEIVNSLGGTDAPGFRILEFAASLPAATKHTYGDQLRKELSANSGWAGDKYLRYITQPDVLDFIRRSVKEWTEDVWMKTGLSSEHRFWVRAIGSVAVAAVLVQKLEILPFSPQRIVDWAVAQVKAYRDDAPITGRNLTAVGALAQFLNEHLGNLMVMQRAHRTGANAQMPVLKPLTKLLMRYELDSGRLAISERAFREWAALKGFGARHVLAELLRTDVCVSQRRMVTLSAGTDYPGGQMPCIEINGKHPALSGMLASVGELQEKSA